MLKKINNFLINLEDIKYIYLEESNIKDSSELIIIVKSNDESYFNIIGSKDECLKYLDEFKDYKSMFYEITPGDFINIKNVIGIKPRFNKDSVVLCVYFNDGDCILYSNKNYDADVVDDILSDIARLS